MAAPAANVAASVASVARIPRTLDVKAPLEVARAFLVDHYGDGTYRLLHFWRDDFIAWRNPHYEVIPRELVRAKIYHYLATKMTPEGILIKPTRRIVDDVLDALRSAAFLNVPRAPVWLTTDEPAPAGELIACRNGLLHIATRRLLPASAAYLTRNAVEFDFDAEAPPPRAWLSFLASIFDSDAESIAALQEWSGYLLTQDTSQQKALLVVGPKRSGKGTVGRVLRALVGTESVCSPTLASLGTPFGLAGLIGKTLALLSDVRLGGRADLAAIAENLLRVTGEDSISVGRKFRDDWTGQLAVRFVVFSNEIPALADASGALASRFVLLQTRRSFFGEEDPRLTVKLLDELPGIFVWALAGLDRLNARGHFTQPASSRQAIEQLELLGSPIKAFLAERCVIAPGADVECAMLFDEWRSWCAAQNREHAGTQQIFGRNLAAAAPGIRVVQLRDDLGARRRWYDGIRLRHLGDAE